MSVQYTMAEFRTAWLPHVSDAGLVRVIGLLESASPLLIHGAFSRACAMGCLATHIAWHHPLTRRLGDEAGVSWLTRVARLNPATSLVIQAWDRGGQTDWSLRVELLRACREELESREQDVLYGPSHGYNPLNGVATGIPSPAACDTR